MTKTASKPLVVFSNVHKTYDGYHFVVSDLDFDIKNGEFLSLLGPSGSSKTTTLMMLAGFETPTEGMILLDEQNLNDLPPHRRDVGTVFKIYALFPHMSVAANITFPLSVCQVPHQEADELVIPTPLDSDLCPGAGSDGGNASAILHQSVPGVAASVHGGDVAVPYGHAKLVATQMLPGFLRHHQPYAGLVPARIVADQQSVG